MSSTPLPLWVVPAADEPAHGILLRLAERNGTTAPGRISSLTGLTVRELRLGIGVERLAAVIKCSETMIRKSTPTMSDDAIVIRGERFGKRVTSMSIRHLCPQCVAESAHHRFWFDLEFVTTCPTHARNLVHTCSCGHDLSWTDVRIAKCRHCDDGDVTLIQDAPARPDVTEMDRWVLGRLGVGSAASIPFLDQMPLDAALHVIGRIGILDIKGFEDCWIDYRDLDVPAAEVRARGFSVLRRGMLDAVLDKVYEGFRSAHRSKPETINNAYGWFGDWYPFLEPRSVVLEIGKIVVANASRKFRIPEREFRELCA